ncbi:hypothetical protein Tco_0717124 [Tanacetum coccineum]
MMQAARDRQKSYADLKRKLMEFQVGDKVMLKVSPWKGVVHFGKRGKLNPRYVGPFKVLGKVREVAYKLDLPEELNRVHNIFHVSNLKKCYADEPLAVLLDGLHFDDMVKSAEITFAGDEAKALEFQVERSSYVKKSHLVKVFIRSENGGKLNPLYIGPFKILKWIGLVAYKLELPEELSNVHSTFYVSNLKKCLSDEYLVIPIKELRLDDKLNFVEEPVEIMDREKTGHKLELPKELSNIHSTFHVSNLKKCLSDESLVILMKELRLDDKLNFVEEPVEIMDREVKQLKQSRIPIVKVRWNSKRGPEFTWEREDQIRAKYPYLFSNITFGILT